MSPPDAPRVRVVIRFPRVSGDEPEHRLSAPVTYAFSPRERG